MLATALGLATAVPCAATAGQPGAGGGVVRVATYNAALTRDGPGLLLHDLMSGGDKQALAAARVVAAARADVLVITRIDYDHGLVALSAFADLVADAGLDYPHRFALRPNSGWQTGRDMVGDGRIGTPDDAQGWGRFAGAGGMAILSRWPIATAGVRDFSGFLWRDLPGAMLPMRDGQPFPSAEVFAHQRLASVGKWEVPVRLPWGETLRVLAFYAGPPVFGGPEGRNALRNHDEVRFWNALLDGVLPMPPPVPPFVLAGDANLDPLDGDGLHGAILGLLAHPAVQDPEPRSPGAIRAQGPPTAIIGGIRRWIPPIGTARAFRATCGWTMSCPRPICRCWIPVSCGLLPAHRWRPRPPPHRATVWSGWIWPCRPERSGPTIPMVRDGRLLPEALPATAPSARVDRAQPPVSRPKRCASAAAMGARPSARICPRTRRAMEGRCRAMAQLARAV